MADSDTTPKSTPSNTPPTPQSPPQSPTAKPTPGSEAARKADSDSAFEKIFPAAGSKPGEAAKAARDQHGRFLPKSEQADLQPAKADHTQEVSADSSPK